MKNPNLEIIALLEGTERKLTEFPLTLHIPFLDVTLAKNLRSQFSASIGNSRSLSVQLLHIRGQASLPIIDVYFNSEGHNDPHLYAGSLALFGLRKSSDSKQIHGGVGLDEMLNVTDIVKHAIRTNNWSDSTFTLTFVPRTEIQDAEGFSIETIRLVSLPDYSE